MLAPGSGYQYHTIMQIIARTHGLNCDSCIRCISTAVLAIPGVADVSIRLLDGRTVITGEQVTFATVAEVVKNAGNGKAFHLTEGAPTILQSASAYMRKVYPLIIMLTGVLVFALVKNYLFPFEGHSFTHAVMLDFMGGFFVFFGGLKVINIKKFAPMYAQYDVVAARFPGWGYAYPVIELALGFAYFAQLFLVPVTIIAAAVMAVGMVGIWNKLHQKDTVTCACLGGFFSVPVTWLTFAENGLMVVMALWMLLVY